MDSVPEGNAKNEYRIKSLAFAFLPGRGGNNA